MMNMIRLVALFILVVSITSHSFGQGYLVDRTTSAVGLQYVRLSNANSLGLLFSRTFEGKFDVGGNISRIFTSPSYSNLTFGAFGEYYFLKQNGDLPVTVSGGAGVFYSVNKGSNLLNITPNATIYHELELEEFVLQPFVNYTLGIVSVGGNSSTSSSFSIGANFAFPGNNDAMFVFTPAYSLMSGSNQFGVGLTYIFPSGSKSNKPNRKQEQLNIPTSKPIEESKKDDKEENKKTNEQKPTQVTHQEEPQPEQKVEREQPNEQLKSEIQKPAKSEETPEKPIEESEKNEKQKAVSPTPTSIPKAPEQNPMDQPQQSKKEDVPADKSTTVSPSKGQKDILESYFDDGGDYYVQIASLTLSIGNKDQFKEALYVGSLFRYRTSTATKIRVGKYKDYEEAARAKDILRKNGYTDAFIVRDAETQKYEVMDYE